MPKKPKGFSQCKENFALAYIRTGVGTTAVREAYASAKHWTMGSINSKAALLKTDPYVTKRIQELRSNAEDTTVSYLKRTLEENARIAFADVRKLFNEDGTLKKVHELEDDIAAAVSSIKVTSDGPAEIKEIKLNDKGAGLEKFFKYYGLYSKDNEQKDKLVIVKDFTGKQKDD